MIHTLADIQSRSIGCGTRIWQYVVILEGAEIGSDCNICSHVFIESDVTVGNRVTIKNGVQLWNGLRVLDDVFIGPNVTFTNDRYPRSRAYLATHDVTVLGHGASIGANATIRGGVRIGRHAMVGCGSVVLRDVGDFELWYGNPATHRGFITPDAKRLDMQLIDPTSGERYRIENGALKRHDSFS